MAIVNEPGIYEDANSSPLDTMTPEVNKETDTEQTAKSPNKSQPVPSNFKQRFPNGISWKTTIYIAGMHVGAIAALFFFSWQGLVAFFILHFMSACLGVTLGYHRLLTHGSFLCHRPLKYLLTICGMLSSEGSPLFWVATHRKHHVHSDEPEDPHSPRHGFWWAHMLWLHPRLKDEDLDAMFKRWAPDLYKDPVMRFFHNWFILVPIVTGIMLYLAGEYLMGGIGISMVLWGLCARVVAVYHGTWFVNSATHMWGYKNYETKDDSRNNWWVAFLSYGEGWHNNHHAYQRLAKHGHRWWEVDITYMMIWCLKKTGLAWKVQDQIPAKK